MSKKKSEATGSTDGLPEDFFDSNKKSKKAQEDELAKELEQFEREMAALQAESEAQLNEEFEKIHEEKNLDELDTQMDQWKRVLELEKKAEELRNKPIVENPMKKFKLDSTRTDPPEESNNMLESDDCDLDDIEEFQDKLLDWRSKGL